MFNGYNVHQYDLQYVILFASNPESNLVLYFRKRVSASTGEGVGHDHKIAELGK